MELKVDAFVCVYVYERVYVSVAVLCPSYDPMGHILFWLCYLILMLVHTK